MLEAVMGILTGGGSTILSSVFGSISGVVGHYIAQKDKEKERQFELDKVKLEMERDKLDSELALKEIQANLQTERVIQEGQRDIEEAKGWNDAVAKIQNSKNLSTSSLSKLLNGNIVQSTLGSVIAFLLGLVDVLRGLVRPVLTYGSFGVMVYLVKEFAVNTGFSNADQMAILSLVIDVSVFVLTSATQFWFMDRVGARKMRGK